jgi:glutamate 5-kinase
MKTKLGVKSKSKRKERWVVKAGSNMILSGGPLLIRDWMTQVAALKRDESIEIIWVSSGAIATAVERTQFKKKKRELPEKQALSAIGQPLVMDLYNLGLQAHGLLGAQVLLTYHDLEDAGRTRNVRNTLEQLLEWGVTPILNENDAVATEEIRFGDNDALSAKVAVSLNADRLVILTDVDGLYDSDPRKNPKAKLIHDLKGVDSALLSKIEKESGNSAGSSRGTGGILTKIRAAHLAHQQGVETWLVRGDTPHVLSQVAKRARVGTRVRVK